MARIDSLFPIPGSKRGAKYSFLAPLPTQDRMSEPFAGGASKSLITALPTIIGDICPAHRAIALAPTTKSRARAFTTAYNEARAFLRGNLSVEVLHGYRRVKQAQKQLRKDHPDMAAGIDRRWMELRDRLFQLSPTDPELPGLYACLQRAAFGNTMRLNPRGTNYNCIWHVGKLTSALRFDPAAWVEGLRSQGWDPWVEDSWQATIQAVKNPAKTYLLLDPPYLVRWYGIPHDPLLSGA